MFSIGNLFRKQPKQLSDQQIYTIAVNIKYAITDSDELISYFNFYPERINAKLTVANEDPLKTVLHHAVAAGNLGLVVSLCSLANLDVGVVDEEGNTPFHLLMIKLADTDKINHADLIQIFNNLYEKDIANRKESNNKLKENEAFMQRNNAKQTPLQFLSHLHKGTLAELLELQSTLSSKIDKIDSNINVHSFTKPKQPNPISSRKKQTAHVYSHEESEILQTIKDGNHQLAAQLILTNKEFININICDDSGFTFAHHALQSINGDTSKLLQALIDAGLDLNIGNNNGVAPLPFVILRYNRANNNLIACIDLMITEGKKSNKSLGMDCIIGDNTFNDCPPIIVAVLHSIDIKLFSRLLELPNVKETLSIKASNECHYTQLRGKTALGLAEALQKTDLKSLITETTTKQSTVATKKIEDYSIVFPVQQMSRNDFQSIATQIFDNESATFLGSWKRTIVPSFGTFKISSIMRAFDAKQYSDDLNQQDAVSKNSLLHVAINYMEQPHDKMRKIAAKMNSIFQENDLAARAIAQARQSELETELLAVCSKITDCANFINILINNGNAKKLKLNLCNSENHNPLERAILMRITPVSLALLEVAISKGVNIGIDHNDYNALTIAFNSGWVQSGQTDDEHGFHLIYCALMKSISTDNYKKTKEFLVSPFLLNETGRFKATEHLYKLPHLSKKMISNELINVNGDSSEKLFNCYLELITMMKNPTANRNIESLIQKYDNPIVQDAAVCLQNFAANFERYKNRNNTEISKTAANYKSESTLIINVIQDTTRKVIKYS